MSYPEYLPPYISPLTDKQHAQLGRIALLWGYADSMLDELLLDTLSLTLEQRAMLIGEKPMGPKLDLLRPNIVKIANLDARSKAKAFFDLLNSTKAQRNHAFHGVWGWRVVERERKMVPASRHPKSLENPIKATDLPGLEAILCCACHLGYDAVGIIRGWDARAGIGRAYHLKDGPQPGWYLRWIEQHPSCDRTNSASPLLKTL